MTAKHRLGQLGADRGRDSSRHPGQHLPLHRLREHRRGDRRGREGGGAGVTTVAPDQVEAPQKGFAGTSIPRKEDRRLVQGEGVFFDDVKRHGMGYVHFVRSPYAHAGIVSIDVSAAEVVPGVYGTLIGEEVAAQTDPFFEMSTPPGSEIRDYALAVGKVRFAGEPVAAVVAETRELARDAAELVEVEYEPLEVVLDAVAAAEDGAPILHDEAGSNVVWSGTFEWGDFDEALAEADHVVKIDRLYFHRFSSTPLECAGALVECDKGIAQWTLHCNHQMPGIGSSAWPPPCAWAPTSSASSPRTSAVAFGDQDRRSTRSFVALCPPVAEGSTGPSSGRSSAPTTRRRRPRERARLPRRRGARESRRHDARLQGTRLRRRRRLPALRAARRVIWAQVTPGCYRFSTSGWTTRRSSRTSARRRRTAATRAAAPVVSTERVVDVVAHELGFDPVEVRKAATTSSPRRSLRDAQRLRLRLRATAEVRSTSRSTASATACAGGTAQGVGIGREAHRHRDRLDARLRHEQLRPVADRQPGAPVLGQRRGRPRKARPLRGGES